MNRKIINIAITTVLCLSLVGCGDIMQTVEPNNNQKSSIQSQITSPNTSFKSQPDNSSNDTVYQSSKNQINESNNTNQAEIDKDIAFSLALNNANVSRENAYNIKIQHDMENDIPIYQVEFETQYGDYDFEIAIANGAIIGADYEVNEEWLDTLGGSPITVDEAKNIIQNKVPGSSANNINIWEENEDGRGRFEGELFYNGIKYEFEIDPQTGIIFDWNADLRE